jgi:hypothetical protein
LYLRSSDGVLFPEVTEKPSATADGIRTSVNMIIETIEAGGDVVGMRFQRLPGSGIFSVEQNVKTVKGKLTGLTFDNL